MEIVIKKCLPRNEAAMGATLGTQHMQGVYKSIANRTFPVGETVILNFKGIEQVNGSYIKMTALWFFLCGQMTIVPQPTAGLARDFTDLRPYDLYVAVSNLSLEVRDEFDDFLQHRRFPMLMATRYKTNDIEEAVLLGHLDEALKTTFESLVKHKTVTAPRLFDLHPNEKITVTAWNNRLNALHSLRLARRIRSGRSWEYQPLTKKILWA